MVVISHVVRVVVSKPPITIHHCDIILPEWDKQLDNISFRVSLEVPDSVDNPVTTSQLHLK